MVFSVRHLLIASSLLLVMLIDPTPAKAGTISPERVQNYQLSDVSNLYQDKNTA